MGSADEQHLGTDQGRILIHPLAPSLNQEQAITLSSSDSLGTPIQQWLSGGLILAAFFVATDPVTHPRSHTAQWLFALVVGCTIMAIRGFGNYPDGIAFAILLGNKEFLNIFIKRDGLFGEQPSWN